MAAWRNPGIGRPGDYCGTDGRAGEGELRSRTGARVAEDMTYIHGQNNREIRVYKYLDARLTLEDFGRKIYYNFYLFKLKNKLEIREVGLYLYKRGGNIGRLLILEFNGDETDVFDEVMGEEEIIVQGEISLKTHFGKRKQ